MIRVHFKMQKTYYFCSCFLVSRIEAHSDRCNMFMHLDVNTEIYPMAVNDKFTMALVTTLNLDGTPDTGYYTQVIAAPFNPFMLKKS